MDSLFCNLEPFFVGGRPQQNQNFSCGWPIWGYFCYRAYWDRPLCCVCYLGCVCIYHPDTCCYISVPFDFKTEEVQCFVCAFVFFSTWSLVSLPESPCLFKIFCRSLLEFQGLCFGSIGLYCLAFSFLLVARGSVLCLIDIPLEHATRYHVWLGHLTMMPFTLYRLFYVIAWGNLLQEVSANGVILFLCFAIFIHVFLLHLYLLVCLFAREEAYIYNHCSSNNYYFWKLIWPPLKLILNSISFYLGCSIHNSLVKTFYLLFTCTNYLELSVSTARLVKYRLKFTEMKR